MSHGKPFRRLRFGLSTLLGIKKLGYFAPYRYAAAIQKPEHYPALEPLLAAGRRRFADLLARAETYLPELSDFSRAPEPRPRFEQDWFPRLDALMAYTIVRTLKPARVMEIGAGHSTRFMALAALDEGAGTRVETIDPAPRADLSSYSSVRVHHHLLQDVPPTLWDRVGPGDIVSLDGSHLLMAGTDVDHFLGGVLPRVAGRAILHIHDIFLPDAYPKEWDWRAYNEQSAIAGLIGSGAFDILWSSRYVVTRMAAELAASPVTALPQNEGTFETSLWLAPKGLLAGSGEGDGQKRNTESDGTRRS